MTINGGHAGTKKGPNLGNENSARSFSDRSFFEPPCGHGRPRLRAMDVRTEMLVFPGPGFRGLDRSFCPQTSAGISAWTSAGYPAPKLPLWAAFSFLTIGLTKMPRELRPILRHFSAGFKDVSPQLRDDPTTTTTIFGFISQGPIFHFWGTPG